MIYYDDNIIHQGKKYLGLLFDLKYYAFKIFIYRVVKDLKNNIYILSYF
uniref:Uncharacterized protein n=1 Tax=Lepeophtheirus salmonis TaxID=72036 RepID=A0A0K2TJ25_LEPSM